MCEYYTLVIHTYGACACAYGRGLHSEPRCYALGARGRRAAGVSRGGTLGLGLYALKSGALESAQILKFSKVCHGIPFEDITSNILIKVSKAANACMAQIW